MIARARHAAACRSPGFGTSTVPSADADPTGRARPTPRRSGPSTTSRSSSSTNTFDMVPRTTGEQEAWILEHSGVHPARGGRRGPRLGRGRAASGPTARSSSASARSRPSASARATRPPPRTPSTSTAPSVARGVGRALLAELLVLASAHGFHSVIARIAGHNETSIGLHRGGGLRAGRRGAGGRAQAPPVARRRRAPAAALAPAPRAAALDAAGADQDSSAALWPWWAGSPGSRDRSIRHDVVQLPSGTIATRPQDHDGEHHARPGRCAPARSADRSRRSAR